jgi:CheY-like chemotaxis protein
LSGKTVLIVDDNETNRRILETILSHWGMKVLSADSGARALTALDRSINAGQPTALVITDLHMPEMDGFQLVGSIRAHAALGNVPILLLSSSSSHEDQQRAAELHIAGRLLKPVKQSLLLDNIMRVMSGTTRTQPEKASAPPSSSAQATSGARSLSLLLAEDNAVNLKFALKLLQREGHRVTVANNGKEAVALWESKPFDLVLMDIQMPEMDGLDATRSIRAKEKEKGGRTPIIAMTANAMAGDREMCIEAGMDGYVTKPVKKDALFAEVQRVLSAGGVHVSSV